MDQRQSIAHDTLMECLLREIGRLLGKDAHYLRQKITIVRHDGESPNWRSEIGIVSAMELSAFRQARESMLATYNLDSR